VLEVPGFSLVPTVIPETEHQAAYKSIADEWLESVAGKKRESVSTVVQIQGFNVPKWSHEQNKINREKAAAGADKKVRRLPKNVADFKFPTLGLAVGARLHSRGWRR
jgi:hypothetical protein